MVRKLREAAQELRSYEQSAVPKGWGCHWDRYCIPLSTTSLNCTTLLPCEIFQIDENSAFWISVKYAVLGRNWKEDFSLTFRDLVLSCMILYGAYVAGNAPRSCKSLNTFCGRSCKVLVLTLLTVLPISMTVKLMLVENLRYFMDTLHSPW